MEALQQPAAPAAQAPAPAPVQPQAPAPQPQRMSAPAPAAPAAAPAAPSPTVYAADDSLVRVKVDGQDMDMRLSDLRAQAQLRTAAEKRFTEAQALKANYSGDIQFANEIRSLLKTNPDAALAKLSEIAGRPLGSVPTPEDENLDPQTRGLVAKIQQLQAKQDEFTNYVRQSQTRGQVEMIRDELSKFPIYQGDPQARERAEFNVAAILAVHGDSMGSISDLAGKEHAKDEQFLRRATQATHDTRLAAMAADATVPAGQGTPTLSTNEPPKLDKSEWKSGKAFESMRESFRALTRGT
jgi:hypothetical protein